MGHLAIGWKGDRPLKKAPCTVIGGYVCTALMDFAVRSRMKMLLAGRILLLELIATRLESRPIRGIIP
jgi:hypothetical protein